MENKIDYLHLFQDLFNESEYPFNYEIYEDLCNSMYDDYINDLNENELIEVLEEYIDNLFRDAKGKYYRYKFYSKNFELLHNFKKDILKLSESDLKMKLMDLITEGLDFISLPIKTQDMILINLKMNWNEEEMELLINDNKKLMEDFLNLKI